MRGWFCLLLACGCGLPVRAELTAAQVGLLVNTTDPDATRVAEHYCRLRGVPEGNVLKLRLPAGETLPRAVYDEKLLPAVRAWLAEPGRQGTIRCLLAVYGMPLRVGPRAVTAAGQKQIAELSAAHERAKKAAEEAQATVKQLEATAPRTPAQEQELAAVRQRLPQLRREQHEASAGLARAQGRETEASLDSELSLLAWPTYDLYRWVPNVLYWGCPAAVRAKAAPVMLGARLDGPTPEHAMRLVTDAVAAERHGLQGVVYLDSRGIKQNPAKLDATGYAGYDESLRELAAVLKANTKLEVVHDDQPGLFAPGACKRAMLYCGWYSLANYIDSFEFVQGAVGYHIASAEATTLRNANSKVWCEKLVEHGIAATLGPVGEPYTVGFPKPYEFFVMLLSGTATLVETHYATLYLNSWMTTLVGDPLYNPFRGRALLSLDHLRISPQGTPNVFGELR